MHTLPFFGDIDIHNLNQDYRVNSVVDGVKLSLDINFENTKIESKDFNLIKDFLNDIASFDKQNRKYILQDLKDGGEAEDYLNFYIDELDDEELSALIDLGEEALDPRIQLFMILKLVRVGLYPEKQFDSNEYAVFDYSIEIERAMSNQMLVVVTNENGALHHVTWES